MAEGFARKYGSDVIEAISAGLSPAAIVQPLTKKVMEDKGISIDDQFPKDLSSLPLSTCDAIINMSGVKLPGRIPMEIREWQVSDPIGKTEEVYVGVRDQIEMLVMQLILQFRREARRTAGDTQGRRPLR
jgi:arsenate reductase